MSLVEWRAVRQASGTVDSDLYAIEPLRLAFNRWASSVTALFDDTDGTKIDDYPRGQRVEFDYSTDGGSSWTTRTAGIVQNRTQKTDGGIPHLQVDLVSYDHLLRRREVFKTYTSASISTILEDLITNFTSITWNAVNVTIQNDATITREFKGTRVDEAISELAATSANEEFGVNLSLEFFFEQQNTTAAPALTDGEIADHDLPTKGKQAVNQFRLFYGASGSESSVLVEDREAQRELKQQLGAPRRVVISDYDTMPEISTEDRAKAVATQRLDDRSELQTGTVKAFRRLDTDPGDVISLTISDAGIDGEDYRVAQVDHQWNTTELTIAENAPNIDDLLVGLSDSLSNVRARDADPSASFTRFLSLESGVEASVSATVIQRTHAAGAFTAGFADGGTAGFADGDTAGIQYNGRSEQTDDARVATAALLDTLRDLWQGAAGPGISHLGVGGSDAAPSRSDTALDQELDRRALDQWSAEGSTTAFAETSFAPGGDLADGASIEEAGPFDAASGGSLYARVALPATNHTGSTETVVQLRVTLDTDSDLQGVITTTGQQRLRDLLVGETGHEPTDMAYGTSTTAVAESDTALGAKVGETAIDSMTDRETGVTDVVDRLGTGELNGNDIAEIGEENAANELLSRLVFEPLSKTSSFALETNRRFQASNP